jgi:ribulose-phosphate 3-epimerase
MIKIAPSVLSADFLRLGEDVKAAERGGADRFQIDVMDGLFVPNISMGGLIIEAMRRATTLPLETHLMIVRPERYIETFAKAGATTIIVHQEACLHLDRILHQIRDAGKKVGVAVNPSTPVSSLEEIVDLLDLVLIMTVNPGFGGQRFIQYTLRKIRQMRRILSELNSRCEIEVDGGIEVETAPAAVEAGAQVLVAGSAVFGYPEGPEAGVKALLKAVAGKGAVGRSV